MHITKLFERCCNAYYTNVENDASYAVLRNGTDIQLFFEASKGYTDWKNNLDFPAKPYKKLDDTVWYAHRGFLKVWKSVEPYIADIIKDNTIKKITIAGYSHGGALAVFCHEYVWFHREDLRNSLLGYGFGCPRVIWGFLQPGLKLRWKNFTVVRNTDDIVTHLPPAVFGYRHVGQILQIGSKGLYSDTDAHKQENILTELKKYAR